MAGEFHSPNGIVYELEESHTSKLTAVPPFSISATPKHEICMSEPYSRGIRGIRRVRCRSIILYQPDHACIIDLGCFYIAGQKVLHLDVTRCINSWRWTNLNMHTYIYKKRSQKITYVYVMYSLTSSRRMIYDGGGSDQMHWLRLSIQLCAWGTRMNKRHYRPSTQQCMLPCVQLLFFGGFQAAALIKTLVRRDCVRSLTRERKLTYAPQPALCRMGGS